MIAFHLICTAWYMGMTPRLDDDTEDIRFLMDTRQREEAGNRLASVGAGTVHLRLQLLFRVSILCC